MKTAGEDLFNKRVYSHPPQLLTPEEDAEEAHLCVRVAAFKATRDRDGERIKVLRDLGDKRNASEQSELDELEIRHRVIPRDTWAPRLYA